MLTKRDLLRSAAMAALVAATATSFPAIAEDAKWPSLLEAKDIAEEGFIYGLPLVMNYAVMHEFAVDTNSGQFKAPFNEINNMHHVATPDGHGGHHAEQRHALLDPLAGSAGRADGHLGAGGRQGALLLGAADRRQYLQLSAISARRATGTEPGDYLVVGPDWKGETPAGIKKVFRSTTPFALALLRTQLFNPDDMPNVEKVQAGYKVQPLSAFLKQPAPPAAPKIDFVPATTAGIKENFFEYLDAALQFVPETARGQGDPREACQDRRRPRQDLRFQGAVARTQGRNPGGHEAGRRQGRPNGWPAETRSSTAGTSARSLATRPSTTAIG